jgi:pyridoxine 5-phosphate synthase
MQSKFLPELHINIDHIATIRNARKTVEPNLIDAIRIIEGSKAIGITTHLREDRRHINDQDIKEVDEYLKKSRLSFTFEMGATEDIRSILLQTSVKLATIVPEKREELTTEGGLNLVEREGFLIEFIKPIQDRGIKVSFFIDPEKEQIDMASKIGAEFIEIHTGTYANLFIKYHAELAVIGPFYDSQMIEAISFENLATPVREEVERIREAVDFAHDLGLKVNLGHGLTISNLPALQSQLREVKELHIGHSVVANSTFYGLDKVINFYAQALKLPALI